MIDSAIGHAPPSTLKKTLRWLVAAVVLVASFDDILVYEVGGTTLRLAHVLIAVAAVVLLADIIQSHRLYLPVGALPLVLLVAVNLVFAFPNKPLMRTVGYAGWFALCALLVFIMVAAFHTDDDKRWLLQVYLLTNGLMCVVCVAQIVVAFFEQTFYTEQFFNLLPRVDAFTSEPSYFACFLIPGWVCNWWLVEKKNESIFGLKFLQVLFAFQSFGIIFSTSRMGLLMAALWVGFRLVACIVRHRAAFKRIAVMLGVCVLLFALNAVLVQWFRPSILMPGTIPGTSEGTGSAQVIHAQPDYFTRASNFGGSDAPRIEGMLTTFKAFTQSPFLGYSLGGVYQVVEDQLGARQVVNLTAELLAAFGIFGFATWVWYAVSTLRCCVPGWKAYNDPNRQVLIGMLWGFVWQIGLLQFNNNILRIYVWVNIGILSVLCGNVKCLILDKKQRETEQLSLSGSVKA